MLRKVALEFQTEVRVHPDRERGSCWHIADRVAFYQQNKAD
jgi:hypothetical protein